MATSVEAVKKDISDKMEKTIAGLKDQLGQIRTGRANPAMLERIRVDYYGTPTPLRQISSVTVPDARTLVIQPWEKTMLSVIEKAIQKSDLGLPPNNDGKVIRLSVPELTEERRQDIVKQVRKRGEEAKVALRNARRDANEILKKAEKDGLAEDASKKALDEIQKITDKFVSKVDEVVKHKEEDVMSI